MTEPERRARRAREMTAIYAVMIGVMLLVGIQFLLLMVALEAFAGRHWGLLLPSAVGSACCFAGSCWLVGHLRPPKGGETTRT